VYVDFTLQERDSRVLIILRDHCIIFLGLQKGNGTFDLKCLDFMVRFRVMEDADVRIWVQSTDYCGMVAIV